MNGSSAVEAAQNQLKNNRMERCAGIATQAERNTEHVLCVWWASWWWCAVQAPAAVATCTHHDPSMKVTPLTAFMTLPLTFTIKRRVLSTAIIKDDDGEGVT